MPCCFRNNCDVSYKAMLAERHNEDSMLYNLNTVDSDSEGSGRLSTPRFASMTELSECAR